MVWIQSVGQRRFGRAGKARLMLLEYSYGINPGTSRRSFGMNARLTEDLMTKNLCIQSKFSFFSSGSKKPTEKQFGFGLSGLCSMRTLNDLDFGRGKELLRSNLG